MDNEELKKGIEGLSPILDNSLRLSPEQKLIFVLENTVLMANRHYEDMKLIAHQAMAALMGNVNQTEPFPETAGEEAEMEGDSSIDGGEIGT